MAYITKSNSLRIISKIDFKKIGKLEGNVYKMPIFCFSTYENNNLLGLRELLKNPELFVKEYYKPIESIDKLKYVYEGGKASYHSNPSCERLNSSYKNFEIPEEVREKGKDEVQRFRSWFRVNQYLIDQPDLFVAKLQMAFGIIISPKAIDFENSGVEEYENLNLVELEKRINKYIFEGGNYFKNATREKKEIISRFSKHTYLAYSNKSLTNNNTRFSEETIKKFLIQYDTHFKKPIKELLVEYYKVLYNPELKFEGQLLEQLGFKACASCHNSKVI